GKDPGFAEMASRARRSLGFSSIVAAALPRSPALRAAFAEDADARRALDLIRQTIRAFPERPRPEHWAILLAVAPAEAGPVAAALRGDEVGRTLLEIGVILGPTSASTAFEESWRHEAEGHPDQAREALRRVAALGVPLPFDP